jgi:hypothetical protein
MTPQHLLRSIARVLPLLVLSLVVPNAARSQPAASSPAGLAPEARARFTPAAEDARLAPGKHDLMLRPGRTGTISTQESSAARPSTALGAAAADGGWTQMAGTPPGARFGHSAIYDSRRDRMVVFGGCAGGSNNSNVLNDVWTLSLGNPASWTQLTPTGTPPSARFAHSAIYDSDGDRMVVFGGNGPHDRDDIWILSLAGTPAWSQLTVTGNLPSPRQGHRAIYDPVRDRMLVFGGYYSEVTPSLMLNDVWALSLTGTSAWTQLLPTGTPPSGRYCHSMIYDPVRDRMVIFGGGHWDGSDLRNDVWAVSLGESPAWTPLAPAGVLPGLRFAHSAIYDPKRDCMVVFGGDYYDGSDHILDEVWALSLAGPTAWMQLPSMCPAPSARAAHSAIYDPMRDHMVVFGGGDASGYLNDAWELDWGTMRWWGDYSPVRLGYSWTYRAGDVPRDTTLAVFGSLVHEGNQAFKFGTPDDYIVSGNVGSAGVVYAAFQNGSPYNFTPHLVFGAIGDGSIFDTGSMNMVRDWETIDPALRASFALGGVYDDVIMIAAYDGSFGANGLNTVVESNLPTCVTPPPGAITGLEWYQRGLGKVAFADVEAYNGNLRWFYKLIFSSAVDDPQAWPLVSGLRPPAPNPTRGTTAVSYAIAQTGRVQLGVYDVSGRLVRKLVDGERRAGSETVVWNGMDASGARRPAGIYFVRLTAPGLRETRRVVLLK